MPTEQELKLAQDAYEMLCKTFESKGWKFTKHEKNLIITLGMQGDDIPMDFVIHCDAKRQIIKLLSYLPFKMSEDKRVVGAMATAYISNKLADGYFGYDIKDGTVFFKLTASFKGSLIGENLFNYMLSCASFTVDQFNDQFLMLNKGALSFEDFLKNN